MAYDRWSPGQGGPVFCCARIVSRRLTVLALAEGRLQTGQMVHTTRGSRAQRGYVMVRETCLEPLWPFVSVFPVGLVRVVPVRSVWMNE
jgi:hypothetical protein